MKRVIGKRVIGLLLAQVACSDLALDPHVPLGSVEVSPDNALILTDEPFTLTPTVYDMRGQEVAIPLWATVHWSADDPSVEITPDGEVTGRAGTNARVTAHVVGLTGGTRLRINPRELEVDVTVLLSQATQNIEGTIPLIAGRGLIFRAYVTTPLTNYYESVSLRATFSLRGREEMTPILTAGGDSIGSAIVDDLRYSYFHEVVVPPSIVQRGLTLTVELDPLGELPSELSLNPDKVSFKIPVLELPEHRVIVVPTVGAVGSGDEVVEWASTLTNTSYHLASLRTMLPITDLEVEVHEPLHLDADLTEFDGWIEWIETLEAIRIIEGRGAGWYYYGAFHRTASRGIAGISLLDGFVAAGTTVPETIAHEVGHNLSLLHAPCGVGRGVDENFPYVGGLIGQWGFDLERGIVFHPDIAFDLMGYCTYRPVWISDYHYLRALRYRGGLSMNSASIEQPVTLVWGRIDSTDIDLNPAFMIEAVPVLPSGEGDYTLAIIGPDEEIRYQSRFTPNRIVDVEAGQPFHFAIPYDGEIGRIVVTGPEGRDEIGRGTEPPMAILRDRSGQVIAIYRNWLNTAYQREGVTEAAEILISEGVPR